MRPNVSNPLLHRGWLVASEQLKHSTANHKIAGLIPITAVQLKMSRCILEGAFTRNN